MTELAEVLAVVHSRIEQYADKSIGEQNTKSILISPVLRALGWEMEDLDEVQLEFKRRSMDNPVDYALFVQRSARLFVEAKALGGNIADQRWAGQIMGYAAVAGVEWVCLTDGDSWHIYNSHVVVPVDQKLFRKVRISEDGAAASETLSLLSKERMRENLIDTLWKAHFVDRQLKAALEHSFGPEPDAALVRLLRKYAPRLSPLEIRAGLARTQIQFDFPAPPHGGAIGEPAVPEGRARGRRVTKAPTSDGRRRGQGTPWRHVTLTDLIAESLIRPPMELAKLYRGQNLSARVEADGQVSFRGKRYESLSTAAGVARVSVAGPFPDREYPQTNGWTFWQFRDEDGSRRELDLLRRRLHESRSSGVSPRVVGFERGS